VFRREHFTVEVWFFKSYNMKSTLLFNIVYYVETLASCYSAYYFIFCFQRQLVFFSKCCFSQYILLRNTLSRTQIKQTNTNIKSEYIYHIKKSILSSEIKKQTYSNIVSFKTTRKLRVQIIIKYIDIAW